MFCVGFTDDRRFLRTDALRRAVLALVRFYATTFRNVAVEFHKLRKVDVRISERLFDGHELMPKPVRRQLYAIGETVFRSSMNAYAE